METTETYGPVTGADAIKRAGAWMEKLAAEARDTGREVTFSTTSSGMLDSLEVTVVATWTSRRADRNPFGDDL